MMLLWPAIFLLLLYALLLRFYSKAWKRLSHYVPGGNAAPTFISVVIPARNEGSNMEALLASIEAQDYPHGAFEVLVVDDFSVDDTSEKVKTTSLPNVKLLQPPGDAVTSSKKRAITTGIENAKGDLIVTTDADCLLPPRWLSTINSFYVEKQASFIAAPVALTNDNSFLQQFQAIDFLSLQGITGASVASRFHTMCNGANLAYRRQDFLDVNGFAGIDHVATGDDMLLMYKIWKKDPARVHYLKSREAIVTTAPMPDMKNFIAQRKRWASKTLVYDDWKVIAVLLLVLAVNLIFPALLFASVWNFNYLWLALMYVLLKAVVEWPFVASVARFFNREVLLSSFLLFQPLHMLYTVFVGVASQFGSYEWKGRKTK